MATDCCPKTFTGFCLDDGIPIAVTLDNGVFISWTDLTTGVKTFGPPPPGVVVCSGSGQTPLDCEVDSVTICVEDTLPVSGTVALDATTLAALETITALQGTSPWVVSGTVSVTEPITVDATDFDIRNLVFATDKVDVSGSSVTTGGLTDAELRAIPVPVSGTVSVTEPVSVDDNGGSLTVDGTVTITQPEGTLGNGAETAVAGTAIQIAAASSTRKKLIVQNVGAANIRVGTTGVAATTGTRLVPGGSLIFDMPNCPTNAIFAIREGAIDSIALAQVVT